MADWNVALIGFVGVMAGGYLNNFMAEDFRRFRDSQALAGALIGELNSHADGIKVLKPMLGTMRDMFASGTKMSLPEMEKPSSPIFEANTENIGLLAPELAEDVAYVYEQIRAFRIGMYQLTKSHGDFNKEWSVAMIGNCIERIDCAKARGEPLLEKLRAHTKASYWARPSTIKQCAVGLVFAAALLGAVIYRSGSADASTNCTTVFDHAKGVLTTVCK
ncbi:hypothetical protein [Paraburkholderia caribensis]|uniref:hypothetical protein n=1 Tax=Paraburkholderia caribensis TaxID=75105 RepID=UPI001CAF5751|nr:hypothetical protein [Paraburkholderia caribensis]CAG9249998.1 conserved hypothetical protein [Paraburkholderia caribensis]